MKKATISASLGALALMASSVGSAATLNVVSSSSLVAPNDVFTLTLNAVGFTEPVGGITLSLAFDASKATLQSAVLPAAGPLRAATGAFLVNNNPTFDWLPGSEIPTGDFAMGVFTFQVTPGATAGAIGLAFSDDGGTQSGWFNGDTADYISGVTYSNANVSVVPAPATLGLLASGPAGLMVRSAARRKRATA